jgi:hypothetical protein
VAVGVGAGLSAWQAASRLNPVNNEIICNIFLKCILTPQIHLKRKVLHPGIHSLFQFFIVKKEHS